MATSAEELTECVICTEIFTDPQVLPCDHTFCKRCVNRLTQGGAVKCPNCNKVCLRDDVKPDFRLATFLDALAKQAEDLTGPRTANVTSADVTSADTAKCEACHERVIDFFCHQCEQWFCKSCTKAHSNMKLSKGHTYVSLAEKSDNAKKRIKHAMTNLQAKAEELKSAEARNAKTMTEIEAAQTQAKQTSQQLRAALHEDVDKYFDVIDERIEKFCQQKLHIANTCKRMGYDQLVKITAEMDKLLKQQNIKVLAEAEQLILKAREIAKSVVDVNDGKVDVTRVSLERNPNWNFEGAVSLQLQDGVAHKLRVNVAGT